MTVLMVNHDLAVVRGSVESVVWLQDGRAQQGTASELLSREKIEEILKLEW
jgi:ABC-type Mn2+/Zn2+ transport system ATPase subunit